MTRGIINTLMITPFLSSQRGNSLTAARIKERLEEYNISFGTVALDSPCWKAELKRTMLGNHFHLIHGFHGVYTGQVLNQFKSLRQIPLLLTMTGTDLNLIKTNDEQKDITDVLTTATRIVVFNEEFRYQLVNLYKESIDKIVTIPQGVYLEEGRKLNRAEFGLHDHEVVFILPSGLREVKNVVFTINALEKARKVCPQIRLLIVGAAIEKDYSGTVLHRLEENHWASYLGEIPHSWMKGLFNLGDVVLNTSRSEGQPQGALEAMSLGKPSILTLVPGNKGVMNHGVEGFYIEDEEDLVIAACNLAASKRLRQLMGAQAQELVKRRFVVDNEIKSYAALYSELAAVNP